MSKATASGMELIAAAILVVALIFGMVTGGIKQLVGNEVVTVTVTKSERVCKSESCKYLVFTPNEVFENTDTFFRFKWNSSDLYAKIVNGKTYKFKVYGIRFGFLSWYRNIVSVEEVK